MGTPALELFAEMVQFTVPLAGPPMQNADSPFELVFGGLAVYSALSDVAVTLAPWYAVPSTVTVAVNAVVGNEKVFEPVPETERSGATSNDAGLLADRDVVHAVGAVGYQA
jgi:hypothetical protein